MKQTLLRIKLPPGSTLYPGRLRTLTASLDKPSAALFARDDAGRTVKYPGVRFVGGKSWVGVLADSEHEDVLLAHTGQILMAVSKEVGSACPVELETHQCSLSPTHHPIAYRANRIAIKKRSPEARTADTADLLTRRIYTSIDRTCAKFGIYCPDIEDLGVTGVKVEREIGMRLETADGEYNEFVSLIDATFFLHAELLGHWFVGNLTARGHGRVARDLSLLGGGAR